VQLERGNILGPEAHAVGEEVIEQSLRLDPPGKLRGVLRQFAPPPEGEGWASRVNGEAEAVAGGAFITAVIAIPLLLPLFFMLGTDFAWRETLADPHCAAAYCGRRLPRGGRTSSSTAR
jgi:hypothetical protein